MGTFVARLAAAASLRCGLGTGPRSGARSDHKRTFGGFLENEYKTWSQKLFFKKVIHFRAICRQWNGFFTFSRDLKKRVQGSDL